MPTNCPTSQPSRTGQTRPLRECVLAGTSFLVAISAGLWLLWGTTTAQLSEELRDNLKKVALGVAATMDGDLHRTLTRPEQNFSPEYMRCVAPLAAVRNSVPGVEYTYSAVMDPDGVTVRFVLDSAPDADTDGDGVNDHASLGEVYDDATETLQRVLRTGIADCEQEPYSDAWGTFVTAYAPINDASGAMVGVVGVDMTAEVYTGRLNAVRDAAVMGLVPGVLISGSVALVVYRWRRGALREEHLVAMRNRRLRDMVDNLPAAAVHISGGTMTLNKAAGTLVGYSADRFTSLDDWFKTLFPGRSAEVAALHARQRDAGFPSPDVVPIQGGDGHTRLIEFTGYASEDSEVWLMNDITEQAAMRERFRVVFEHSTVVHMLIDDGGIFDCNSAALSLFGVPGKGALIGRRLEALCPATQADGSHTAELLRGLILASRNDRPQMTELAVTSSDGREVPVGASFTHVTLDARPVTLVVLNDLSSSKRAEAKLRAAMEAAEEASRAKSDFLANMSHEIRTPMTAILGYADLMLDPDQSEEVRRMQVETVRHNGEHLLTIINDILDLSKIEAGKMTLESHPFDPAQVCVQVHDLMLPRAQDKDLALRLVFETQIPRTIHSDPTRLRQILINLIGNALKFTSSGGVTVRISRAIAISGPGLAFAIEDSGIGMSPEALARLFQPFTQADTSTTRKYGGTGLGLTISRHLSQLLGGDVTVTSEIGKGSTFRVVIACAGDGEAPLQRINEDQVRIDGLVRTNIAPTRERTLEGARVLLAEDGLDNQRLICFHLQKAGATVDVASNGRIAVEKASEAWRNEMPFDVILMDMQMPELDGYDASRELRALGYEGPIVALTAHAMNGDRDKCLAAGCDDYATKPIDRDKLLETCRSQLRGELSERRQPS